MPELNIDIELPAELQSKLTMPDCASITLPPPKKLEIKLPMGGSIQAITDATKAIPDDCSLSFSLALQLGPILASFGCLFKLLGLIKPLVDVINGLPAPPVKAIIDFGKAAAELAECFVAITPAGMIPFVKDILCLIIKVLSCLVDQLKSIANVMGGLALQIELANSTGNSGLLEILQCAQNNATQSAGYMTAGLEPIFSLLSLAEPFLGIAGVNPIQLPSIGSAQDVDSINQVVGTLETLVQTLTTAADALGGCG